VNVKAVFDLKVRPHRRFNPLTREWVLVSPHRTQRPWQGQVESVSRESALPFDPNCYLCPGNARAGGAAELREDERMALADLLRQVAVRCDNLFSTPFPYTMGFQQKPTDGQKHPEFHLHGHFYPPRLRSATVKKFMVGYELLAMPQRDITAETAAAYLRETSDVHYLEKS
jgi:galactose-1-phosphate uridylyltransferase